MVAPQSHVAEARRKKIPLSYMRPPLDTRATVVLHQHWQQLRIPVQICQFDTTLQMRNLVIQLEESKIERLAYSHHVIIHLSINCYLLFESQRQQIQEKKTDISLHSDTLQLLLGDPEAFPGQKGYTIPQ